MPKNNLPLGTNGNRATTAGQRVAGRSDRHWLKSAQRGLTYNKSSEFCFFATPGSLVTVSVGRLGIAHVSGVRHCGSPWACAICAPVIREKRARDIDAGASGFLDGGGSALFVSLTGPHHFGDPLEPLLAVMSKCMRSVTSGRPWKALRDRLGYIGSIRALEITYGKNGWHPHAHSLMLFEAQLSVEDVALIRAHIFGAHQRALHRRGFGDLHPVHGVDVRVVGDASPLSSYLTKVEGGWGVGLELARADLKHRGETPFDLLRRCAEGELGQVRSLWREYERSTHGKKFLVWGVGLRNRLLPGEPEISDGEAASLEGEDEAVVIYRLRAEEWNIYCRTNQVAEVLERLEKDALLVMELADVMSGVFVEKREFVDA